MVRIFLIFMDRLFKRKQLLDKPTDFHSDRKLLLSNDLNINRYSEVSVLAAPSFYSKKLLCYKRFTNLIMIFTLT